MAADAAEPPRDPPPAGSGRIDPREAEPIRREERPAPEDTVGRRWGVPALIAWVTLSAFAGALWFAYEQGVRTGMETAPPLVRAYTGPVKVPPDDPGGVQVPHQDKEIYERMAGGEAAEEEEARLRPDPEQPVPKEALLASSAGGEPAGTSAAPVPPPAADDAGPAEEKGAAGGETAPESARRMPSAPPLARPTAAAGSPILSRYRVQLGAYRSAAAAERAWGRLAAREESLLGPLDHVVTRGDLGDRGIYYRLQAGPFEGSEAARAMCRKLGERELDCLVVGPAAR